MLHVEFKLKNRRNNGSFSSLWLILVLLRNLETQFTTSTCKTMRKFTVILKCEIDIGLNKKITIRIFVQN